MQNSSEQFSGTFNISGDHSLNNQKINQRLNNLFTPDKEILHNDQKRMVVFGSMQQQKKTMYQILQPYFWTAAQKTSQAASYAGRQLFQAISNGASWFYDKLINTVIPYTREQIPKWFLVTKKKSEQNKKSQNTSSSYYQLQIQQDDYKKIKNNKNNTKKSKIIISLDKNDDPQFIQFLKKQNFVQNNSFPIDIDQDQDSQTMIIPSGNFRMRYNQTLNKLSQSQQISKIKQLSKIKQKQQQKQKQKQQNIISLNNQNNQPPIHSIIDQFPKQNFYQQIQNYKKVQKKIVKLKDCYIFQLQGKNSIEYDLLDGIEKDQNTFCGYLIKSNKFSVPNTQVSAQVPSPPKQKKQKNVSPMKVKVQIPKQNINIKQNSQELNLQFA